MRPDFIILIVILAIIWWLCLKSKKESLKVKEVKTFGDLYFKDDDINDIKYSYEKVDLDVGTKTSYLEFFYLDDNDEPIAMPLATKCRIHECDHEGTVLRVKWGYPGDCDRYKELRNLESFV